MELKPGYKKTDVGVIPENWEVKRLGDVIEKFVGGGTPSRSIPHYWGNEIPWVTVKDFETFHPRHSQEAITRAGLQNSASHLIPNGTLITSTRMALGKAVVYEVDVAINQDLKALFPIPVLATQYLYCWFQYHGQSIDKLGSGSTVKGISLPDLKKIEFQLPPLPEQIAMATVLSDMDALIESLGQLIAKKRQIKQGAMQELLTGKRRLPGFQIKPGYKKTEVGVIPEDWEVKALGDVAEIRSGGTPSTNQPEFWDGDVLWCTPTDITGLKGFKYLTHTSRTITIQGLKCSSAELVPAYSVVMTSRATIGECAINAVPVATNQGFKNFVPFQTTDGEFLYYLLQTKKQDFISLCGGSTFLEIGKTQLAAFNIALPKEKLEQTAIATVLSDMDAEIEALESKLAKSRELKQGMMQELLTGRIRIL